MSDSTDNPDDIEVYRDTADRLERALDIQIEIINGIDDKAEHVTRLIGLLIGIVFSVLSIALQFDSMTLAFPPLPVQLAFLAGIASLLLSMAAAIVTYLSSRFKIGLNPVVGSLLSNPDYDTTEEEHLRRVLGTYA